MGCSVAVVLLIGYVLKYRLAGYHETVGSLSDWHGGWLESVDGIGVVWLLQEIAAIFVLCLRHTKRPLDLSYYPIILSYATSNVYASRHEAYKETLVR